MLFVRAGCGADVDTRRGVAIQRVHEGIHKDRQRIHRHGEIVEVRFVYPTRNDSPPRDEGEAFITDFTTGANNGDLATASMTLTGREKLEYVTP